MKRAIILKYIFVTGLAAHAIGDLRSSSGQWTAEEESRFETETAERSKQNVDRLKVAGLWQDVERDERVFLQTRIDQITAQQRIDAGWLAESIVCLLWATQLLSQIPPYDQEAHAELVNALPPVAIRDLVKQARLRPLGEIKEQRDLAELWHWRARTRQLQEEGRLNGVVAGGYTIEQIIERAATKGAQDWGFPNPIGSDFPALGKPYRDLTFEEYAKLTSIAQERHKALNWLCGLSPRGQWADTPTST